MEEHEKEKVLSALKDADAVVLEWSKTNKDNDVQMLRIAFEVVLRHLLQELIFKRE